MSFVIFLLCGNFNRLPKRSNKSIVRAILEIVPSSKLLINFRTEESGKEMSMSKIWFYNYIPSIRNGKTKTTLCRAQGEPTRRVDYCITAYVKRTPYRLHQMIAVVYPAMSA